jgi:hypothetical protein
MMADLGVDADLSPADFLAAMDGYKERDPQLAIVVSAIKATVKGGLGKLRERPRGEGWRLGEPWRALSRPTWRLDIRAFDDDGNSYQSMRATTACPATPRSWLWRGKSSSGSGMPSDVRSFRTSSEAETGIRHSGPDIPDG